MKKNTLILLIIVAVIGLLAWLRPKPAETGVAKKDGGKGKLGPASVNVHVAKQQKLANKLKVSGTIIANQEVELHPEVSGKVVKIFFEEGSKVSKGDLLLKLNDAELQAQLMKTEYLRKLAEENEFRQHKLLDIQALSQQEYDVVLNQLNAVKADVQMIKAQVAKTEIRAPFDGTVGLRYVNEGSFVSPTTEIASLQSINPVKIDFTIPEKYVSRIRKNDAVLFSISGSDKVYKGAVYAIEPKIDPLTRTVKVRAVYANESNEIYPGSFASVELIMSEISDALMVPTQAIIPQMKGQKVYLCKNGLAVPQNVEIGLRTESTVQVTKGLAPGDSVITTGIMQLKPDMPVKILKK